MKTESLEDYLSSCPGRDMNQFLTTKCSADMCHQDKNSIFLDKQGQFRKPMKINFLCNSNSRLCGEYQKSVEEKFSNTMTCKKNTFENFDSLESLQCNWNNETTEQVQCMENMFEHSFTTNNIICCSQSSTTVFKLQSKEAIVQQKGNYHCDREELFRCNNTWSSWSQWKVILDAYLNKPEMGFYRNPILNQSKTGADTCSVMTVLQWIENMHIMSQST